MARKFLTALDLSKNELQNAAAHNLPSAPAAPVKGQLYFNTTAGDNTLYWWDGSTWIAAKATATIAMGPVTPEPTFGTSPSDGVAATASRSDHQHGNPVHDGAAHAGIPISSLQNPFGPVVAEPTFGTAAGDGASTSAARADHVHGNPLHDAAAHASIPISALAPATGPINMGGFPIHGVGPPTDPGDATNKQYVDDLISGLSWKDSVEAATVADIVLSGHQTIDGIALVADERVLVKNQTDPIQNGIYRANAGAWTRGLDSDAVGELDNSAVFVEAGDTMGDTAWVCTSPTPVTPGTTPVTWVQFTGAAAINAGAGLTKSGNTIDVVGDPTIIVSADSIARAAITGPIIINAGSNTSQIVDDAVANAHLMHMPVSTVKANLYAADANPQDVPISALIPALGVGGLTRRVLFAVGGAVSQVLAHALAQQFVQTQVFRSVAPFDQVECDIECTDANNVTVRFAVAPAAGEYQALIIG